MLIYFFRKENHVTAAIDKGAPPAMSGGYTTPPAIFLYLTCSFATACSLLMDAPGGHGLTCGVHGHRPSTSQDK